ncbi:MAG: protease complex subunit PrcB family protein [Lachnospiraceae bacterium]|nr:protease complex subunit PrcB family protein [Lachnospiraceae bacterium]MBR4607863.1 protease complex subunit PrcB family protein [Lachnospiraceae bacterium]MBR6150581.1 protease complex subunit PrcB family protein [Lachnospiraceae bacterium]
MRERLKHKRSIGAWIGCFVMLFALFALAGCLKEDTEKVRDLTAVIVSEEALPAELKTIIDGKKEKPFQLTYSDKEYLYICIGYGKQETGGYSIVLNDLYLTETEVRVDTTLLGPELSDQAKKTATYPYLVIRTELVEQPVVFR